MTFLARAFLQEILQSASTKQKDLKAQNFLLFQALSCSELQFFRLGKSLIIPLNYLRELQNTPHLTYFIPSNFFDHRKLDLRPSTWRSPLRISVCITLPQFKGAKMSQQPFPTKINCWPHTPFYSSSRKKSYSPLPNSLLHVRYSL